MLLLKSPFIISVPPASINTVVPFANDVGPVRINVAPFLTLIDDCHVDVIEASAPPKISSPSLNI